MLICSSDAPTSGAFLRATDSTKSATRCAWSPRPFLARMRCTVRGLMRVPSARKYAL